MAFPAEVDQVSLSYGQGYFLGEGDVSVQLTIVPNFNGAKALLWTATGELFLPFPLGDAAVAGDDNTVLVPRTDQDGWVDDSGAAYKHWTYAVTLRYQHGSDSTQLTKVIQPTEADMTNGIDLEAVFSSSTPTPPEVLATLVRSVNGIHPDSQGNVQVSGGGSEYELPARLDEHAQEIGNDHIYAYENDGWYLGGPGNSDIPTGAGRWLMQVLSAGSGYVYQRLFVLIGDAQGSTYERYTNSGISGQGYSDWVLIGDTSGASVGGRLGKVSADITGMDLNAITANGFYAGSSMQNAPGGDTGAFYLIVQANNAANGYWKQIITKAGTGTLGAVWVRQAEGNGGITAWIQIADQNGAFDSIVRARTDNYGRLGPIGVDLSDKDLNDFHDSGFYGGFNLTNSPNGGGEFFVIVTGINPVGGDGGHRTHQVAFGYDGPGQWCEYHRMFLSGAWTAWVRTTDQYGAVDQGLRNDVDNRLATIARDITGFDANNITNSGWYRGNNVTNAPNGDNGWFFFQSIDHGDGWTYQHALQYTGDGSRNAYERYELNSVWSGWVQIGDAQGAVDPVARAGAGTGGVSQSYVDDHDSSTLQAAQTYTDNKLGQFSPVDQTARDAASAAQNTANGKYTLPSGGAPKTDLAASVQTSLGKADTALQSAPVVSVAGKTGAVSLVKGDVGLGSVDNTSDANKPVSSATQTALSAKADLVGGVIPTAQLPALAINDVFVVASQAAMLALTAQRGDIAKRTDQNGLSYVLAADDPTTLANWTSLDAPDAVSSVNGQAGTVVLGKSDVGLGNVDNTSDANKPVSSATQTALNAKAPLASPAFTGTVTGITAAMVGLGSVNNTADSAKPVSTAQATAIAASGDAVTPSAQTISAATTLTYATSGTARITMGASATLTVAAGTAGRSYTQTLVLVQDTTGSRVATWSGVKWAGGTAPTLSTAANAIDIVTLFWSGTEWIGVLGGKAFA